MMKMCPNFSSYFRFHSWSSSSVASFELASAADCSPSHHCAVEANFSLSWLTSPITGCASNASFHSPSVHSVCHTRRLAATIAPWLWNGRARAMSSPNAGLPQHRTNASAASA